MHRHKEGYVRFLKMVHKARPTACRNSACKNKFKPQMFHILYQFLVRKFWKWPEIHITIEIDSLDCSGECKGIQVFSKILQIGYLNIPLSIYVPILRSPWSATHRSRSDLPPWMRGLITGRMISIFQLDHKANNVAICLFTFSWHILFVIVFSFQQQIPWQPHFRFWVITCFQI